MGNSKVWICILTVLLVCTLLLMGNLETGHPFVTASFPAGAGAEEVKPWYDTYSGNVYFFLPGSVELENVTLNVNPNEAYCFGGMAVEDGMNCSVFQWNEGYGVEGPMYDGKTLVFVRTSRLPTMFVEVDSGSMEYLHQNKKHTEHGRLRMYDSLGQSLYQGELYSVKGRGQSSWLEEKKSYNISLRTGADLLGMGDAVNWVLQANSKDSSALRNKMIFDFASAAALAYAPDSEWVDLYLNGEYAGLYLLCERIEVHPERVNIPAEGSFLVTKDGPWRFETDQVSYFVTQAETALGIKYSDWDIQTLARMWQSVENAILAEDGVDPVSGRHWTELIDLDSWVDKYLIEEVFGNSDGQILSQYYYLDGSREDGRICAGPVWDYDLAVSGPYNAYHMSKPDVYGAAWQPALFAKEEFYSQLQHTYKTIFRPLVQQLVDEKMDAYADAIRESHYANSKRWFSIALEEEVQSMKQYLQNRTALFDRIWLGGEEYVRVNLVDKDGVASTLVQEKGSLLPRLDNTQGYGWFCESGEPDITKPIYEDISLWQRKLDSNNDDVTQSDEVLPEEGVSPQRYLPVLVLLAAMAVIVVVDFRQRFRQSRFDSDKKIELRRS